MWSPSTRIAQDVQAAQHRNFRYVGRGDSNRRSDGAPEATWIAASGRAGNFLRACRLQPRRRLPAIVYAQWLSGTVGAYRSESSARRSIRRQDRPQRSRAVAALADLHGMPPSLLVTSTRDILLSDTAICHRALLRAGDDAQLVVFEALPHAFWYHFQLPETKEALELMAKFSTKKSGDRHSSVFQLLAVTRKERTHGIRDSRSPSLPVPFLLIAFPARSLALAAPAEVTSAVAAGRSHGRATRPASARLGHGRAA